MPSCLVIIIWNPYIYKHCSDCSIAKAMLIKESVLRPEIFQILSASQVKNTHRRKAQNNIRSNFVYSDICIVIHIYIQQNLGSN